MIPCNYPAIEFGHIMLTEMLDVKQNQSIGGTLPHFASSVFFFQSGFW